MVDTGCHLADEEWLALDFVYALDVEVGESALEVVGKHTGVKLGHYDRFVAAEHLGCVGREGVDVVEVGEVYGSSCRTEFCGGSPQVSVCTAPADKYRVGSLGLDCFEWRDVVGYACYFFAAGVDHLLMVGGVDGDCACVVVFFKTAHAVCGTFGSGNGPVAHHGFLVA